MSETELEFIGKDNRYIQVHSHIFTLDKSSVACVALWTIVVMTFAWGLFVR